MAEGRKENFDILEEAQRIARGQSLPESDAKRVVDEVEFPDLVRQLGEKGVAYIEILDRRNTEVSNQLADDLSAEISKADQRLDDALAQAKTGENPDSDRERALDEYFKYFIDGTVSRKIMEMWVQYGFKDRPTNQQEDLEQGPFGGNDLIPALALAKMVYVKHRRDRFGPIRVTEDGGIAWPIIKEPRFRSDEEKWKLARLTVEGYYKLTDAFGGITAKEGQFGDVAVGYIIQRAKKEYKDKGITENPPHPPPQ